MLEEIDRLGGVEQIPTMVARAKDKNDPFRLMGFGHRVYKSYDPRAKLMRQVGEGGGWVPLWFMSRCAALAAACRHPHESLPSSIGPHHLPPACPPALLLPLRALIGGSPPHPPAPSLPAAAPHLPASPLPACLCPPRR